jgi:hypothetical protein
VAVCEEEATQPPAQVREGGEGGTAWWAGSGPDGQWAGERKNRNKF